MKPVEQVLKDAGVKKDEIDDVSGQTVQQTSADSLRSSLSEVLLVFPRFSNSSKTTSMERSLPRESTPTRLSHTEPLFKVVFFPATRGALVFSSSMSAR
jgi:hypothetical protein